MTRNLAIRLLAYCSATAAVLMALNAYVALHPIYRAKAGRIDELYAQLAQPPAAGCIAKTQPRTLVIGNSYVARSFAAPDECRFFKFTVSAMPLLDAVAIVENLKPSFNIGKIVLGVGYNEANPVNSDSSMYMRYWTSLPWSRLLWSLDIARGRGMALTLLKEDLNCLSGDKHCARNTAPAKDLDIEPTQENDPEATLKKSIRARYLEYRPSTRSVSPKLHQALAKLAAACQARGIELLLYTAPIAPQLRTLLGADFVADFHAEISRAAIPYVDLNELSSDWRADHFLDATHVNELGSRVVTSRLLQLLEVSPARQAKLSLVD